MQSKLESGPPDVARRVTRQAWSTARRLQQSAAYLPLPGLREPRSETAQGVVSGCMGLPEAANVAAHTALGAAMSTAVNGFSAADGFPQVSGGYDHQAV